MAGVSNTSDIFFAACLLYLYSEESLLKASTDERGGNVNFTFDIPSEDHRILLETFLKGELALSDAKAFSRSYSFITRTLREMKRNGTNAFCSPSWIAGAGT